jgi:hypothetical protein
MLDLLVGINHGNAPITTARVANLGMVKTLTTDALLVAIGLSSNQEGGTREVDDLTDSAIEEPDKGRNNYRY